MTALSFISKYVCFTLKGRKIGNRRTVSGQYYALFKHEMYDILHGMKGMLSRKADHFFPIMPHLVKLLMFYAIKLQFILTNNTDVLWRVNWRFAKSKSLTEYLIAIKY